MAVVDGPIVILNSEQLRQLASIIYHQEVEATKNIKFASEPELAKYLGVCRANYNSVVGLLDAAGDLKARFDDDDDKAGDHTTRARIAEDIYEYVVNGTNFALQIVRNYSLRTSYLSKISEHAAEVINDLEALDPAKEDYVSEASRLAEEAHEFRNTSLELTRSYQSPAFRNFSRALKESGLTFDQLVTKYQNKCKFEGPFEDLRPEQKIEVYGEIIEASGRGRVLAIKLWRGVGISMLLFTAGLMVWDIFSSEHIILTATRDAVVAAASVGGAMLGEVIGVAVSTLAGIESPVFLVLAGFITSIAGAYLLGEFAAWLVDLIFGTGGAAPFSTEGHRCYVAAMPDGPQLAREIAHQK